MRREICTSAPMRTSTGISSGFVRRGHSSPPFGYRRTRSRLRGRCSRTPGGRGRISPRADGAVSGGGEGPTGSLPPPGDFPSKGRGGDPPGGAPVPVFTFVARVEFPPPKSPRGAVRSRGGFEDARASVGLLGPCYKTGRNGPAGGRGRTPPCPYGRGSEDRIRETAPVPLPARAGPEPWGDPSGGRGTAEGRPSCPRGSEVRRSLRPEGGSSTSLALRGSPGGSRGDPP